MIVELKRTKIGELLGDGGVESGEIASTRGQREKRQSDKEQPTQHRVCSTHRDRSRQLAGVAASLRDACARLTEPRLRVLIGNSGAPAKRGYIEQSLVRSCRNSNSCDFCLFLFFVG